LRVREQRRYEVATDALALPAGEHRQTGDVTKHRHNLPGSIIETTEQGEHRPDHATVVYCHEDPGPRFP